MGLLESPHCHTIGHSNHTVGEFITLLKNHQIDTLIDIRSYPVSKYLTQYNKENLENILHNENITYYFLGDLLGGLYRDPIYLFPDGIVDYNKVSERPGFQEGLRKVERLIDEGKRLVLMCSEKDPFDCHRFVLVSRFLNRNGISIDHILSDGGLVSQKSLEDRLRNHYRILSEENLDSLYEQRNRDLFDKKTEKNQHSQKNIRAENFTISDYSPPTELKDDNISDKKDLPENQDVLKIETEPGYVEQTHSPLDSQKQEIMMVTTTQPQFNHETISGAERIQVFTIGFTKKSAQQFFDTLSTNNVRLLIDVRLNNKSQLAGFTKFEDLKFFLTKICGIPYIHMPICAPTEELLKRYQKKEIKWLEYEKEYLDLLKKREVQIKFDKTNLDSVCFLCSEPKADQCHRRLLAEYLKLHFPDMKIIHL
jgi:uncharacterized protein (DUF488 family)